jgi:hypothetical protein
MRKLARSVVIGGAILVATVVTVQFAGSYILRAVVRATICETATAERVSLPGTAWSIVTEVFRCSALDGGFMTIVALNPRTKARIKLFTVDSEALSHTIPTTDGITELVADDFHVVQLSDGFGPYKATLQLMPANEIDALLDSDASSQ